MRAIFLRYGLVIVLALAAVVTGIAYHGSGLYTGPNNVDAPSWPRGTEIFTLLMVAGLLVGLKYPIYETVASVLRKRYDTRSMTGLFYAFYAAALVIDLHSLFVSTRPVADSGFAVFAVILFSPPVLILGLIVLGLMVLANPQKK